MITRSFALFAAALVVVACGDDEERADTTTTATDATASETSEVAPDATATETAGDTAEVPDTTAEVEETTEVVDDAGDATDSTADAEVVEDPTADCDPLDPGRCALPYPSNLYLVADEGTQTGYRLDFGRALPRNRPGTPIDPAPYRRLDGYGVGTPLLVVMPNVDLTGLATEFDVAPSLEDDAKIVWYEIVGEGKPKRVPYFVDVDSYEPDPAKRVTIVRPARLLREKARYVVAFRDMVDTEGAPIPRSAAFQALLDGATSGDPKLAPRQARFDEVFELLEEQGVTKASLTLAWDFVTASGKALHGPMLAMRDAGLEAVGEDGPELVDVEVEDLVDDTYWAFEIRGRFKVPNFTWPKPMFNSDGEVYEFELDEAGLPKRNGDTLAPFWVRVPKSATDGTSTPHGLILYGHGQNGAGTQVRGGQNGKIANAHKYIFFATDMWGMSEGDLGGIIDMLFDMSGFPRMADRLQQGILNHVLLVRAMKEQLPTRSEITSRGVVVDTTRVFYSGISQGGNYGPSIVAVSPDLPRGHFGVPGNNYPFLLQRSRNFEDFFVILKGAYPDRADQLILLTTIGQIWEQSDSVSYIRHLHADPFPLPGGGAGTPKEGLWAPAKGDVQVCVTTNEWLARSEVGIAIMRPYDTVTRPEVSGAEMADYPRTGSGVVLYDYGNPWHAESVNLPPTSDMADPHGKPRQEVWHSVQMDHFFRTGEIIDVCSDDGTAGCDPD
ncbi:MAG: hypothetical protein IT385_18065 [Deltaproteobacteria bacterium]|nr:hypothetical protein [Deltaproteobacteria bacterium]